MSIHVRRPIILGCACCIHTLSRRCVFRRLPRLATSLTCFERLHPPISIGGFTDKSRAKDEGIPLMEKTQPTNFPPSVECPECGSIDTIFYNGGVEFFADGSAVEKLDVECQHCGYAFPKHVPIWRETRPAPPAE